MNPPPTNQGLVGPGRPAHASVRAWLIGGFATVAIAGLLLIPGQWQAGRASYKSERLAVYAERAAAAPIALSQIEPSGDNLFRRVQVAGRYVEPTRLLLDNQMRGGQSGLLVFQALALGDRQIIVERGWIARDRESRAQLPAFTTPSEAVQLTGALTPPPASGLALGPSMQAFGRDWLVTRIGAAELAVLGPNDTGDMVLKIDPAQPGALAVERQPALGMAPDRHSAYAFQFRALAAGLAGVYLVLLFRRLSPRFQ